VPFRPGEEKVDQAAKEGKLAKFNLLWFATFALASTVWCVTAASRLGPTFDEPGYINRGLQFWRTGSQRELVAGGGTMPLAVDLFTLPVYLWERWQGAPMNLPEDLPRILLVARTAVLVFWWLLLFYGWRTGQMLAGPWGGRLAVALLACEPILLGHACLATTDLALCACLLGLAYHYRIARESVRRTGSPRPRATPWERGLHQSRQPEKLRVSGPLPALQAETQQCPIPRALPWAEDSQSFGLTERLAALVPALWLGMSVLAKASGLVFGLLCLAVLEGEYLLKRRRSDGVLQLRHSLQTLAIVVLGGCALVFGWCGDSAYHALRFQMHHSLAGHGTIFLLEQTRSGFWYYFPVALSVKLTLTLLTLTALMLIVRPSVLWNWAFLMALALLAITPCCKVQVGVRLVLPLVVFGVIGVAAGLVRSWESASSEARRVLLASIGSAGILWSAWATASVWPSGLCYTNELWGGTSNGYRLLSDSNYDWGQGLPELARWQRQHRLASMDVWYYGTDPALYRLPLRELCWNALAADPDRLRELVQGRFFAASTSLVYGSNRDDPAARFLRTCTPVARTSTFLIYNFTHP
jgi:hypothetical protein